MSASASFDLLDARIQHFIWSQGWAQLRDVQEQAIPHVLAGERDLVIAAETAAGKTEAAFLPALSRLLQSDPERGLIVYVSPLKALINDQFARLQQLCEGLELPVWPWHGDISSSSKTRFLKKPRGVLLITPEALEAMLCNRGTSVAHVFAALQCFVIDELHAFIGTERGKQLQSLLHRIERVRGRPVVRIGLSATLGDMRLAAEYLRPAHGAEVVLVQSESEGTGLKMLIKGYVEPLVDLSRPLQEARPKVPAKPKQTPAPEARAATDARTEGPRDPYVEAQNDLANDDDASFDDAEDEPEPEPIAPAQVAEHLFKVLRGSNNLVFPNRRHDVERYTRLLNHLCEQAGTPNEFWPHHGNLSKELRSETEAALKAGDRPASAVCTNTLELGIDIGAVRSVAQVGTPHSVASLRQRLGRSGRRDGEPKILRGYVVEHELGPRTDLADALRLETVQLSAMVSLLLEGWFEPPVAGGLHLSTLVQQLLSLIAQRGGINASDSYAELCGPGAPFAGLKGADYAALLRHLGKKELLMQDSSGLLLHARVGERIVNHYSFYAAFAADEEFKLIAHGKPLGSLPVSQLLHVGQRLLFAGKAWLVQKVDEAQKTIYVSRARGGVAPMFAGGRGNVHTTVRNRMRSLLESGEPPRYLDPQAQALLDQGRRNYAHNRLGKVWFLDSGTQVTLLTWLGDAGNEALACMLTAKGHTSWTEGPGVEVMAGAGGAPSIRRALHRYAEAGVPDVVELLAQANNLEREKWDWALPPELLRRGYASLHLDLDEALGWIRRTLLDTVPAVPAEEEADSGA